MLIDNLHKFNYCCHFYNILYCMSCHRVKPPFNFLKLMSFKLCCYKFITTFHNIFKQFVKCRRHLRR